MTAFHREVSATRLCFLVQPSLAMVGINLTLHLDASLHFPPALHCSHQLMVMAIRENLSRSCVHVGGKTSSPFSPEVLTCSLCTSSSFWMKQPIWSKVGLCVGSRLQHACMMLYLQDQTGTGRLHCAAGGSATPGSSLQHSLCQGHSTEQPLVFFHKTHRECMCSAPGNGEHWSG